MASKKVEFESEVQELQEELSCPWRYGDVVFMVQGKPLYCNKTVLSIISPVFEAMLEDKFEQDGCEVPLPDRKYGDMLEFFRCVHPHVDGRVTDERLEELLMLADEYQCQMLTRRCRDFIAAQLEQSLLPHGKHHRGAMFPASTSSEDVLRWLRLTECFLQDPLLLEDLVLHVTNGIELDDLKEEPGYKQLGPDSLRLLIDKYVGRTDDADPGASA